MLHQSAKAAADWKYDLLIMEHKQTFRCAICIASVLACTFGTLSPIRAASAVAIAIDPKTGKWEYGYWLGGLSESDVKNHAIRACITMGGRNPQVLASTPRRGYGAIILFETADKKPRFTASLAARTEQLAIRDALQKAKAAGGRYARVLKTWNDTSSKAAPPVIKL